MNDVQRLWWRQAKSDLATLEILRNADADACQQLHYLQMLTEKLAKASFWRRPDDPPRLSHAGFVRFLRFLGQRGRDGERIAAVFGFKRFEDMQAWIRVNSDLAYEIQKLAPQLAGDGPNPEYPWPPNEPRQTPVDYKFPVWNELTRGGRGDKFLAFLQAAVERFEEYA